MVSTLSLNLPTAFQARGGLVSDPAGSSCAPGAYLARGGAPVEPLRAANTRPCGIIPDMVGWMDGSGQTPATDLRGAGDAATAVRKGNLRRFSVF